MQGYPGPVIAVVRGSVWGAACDLIMTCDMVCADQTASFAITPAGDVVAIDFWAEPDADPCEVRFSGRLEQASLPGMPAVMASAYSASMRRQTTAATSGDFGVQRAA